MASITMPQLGESVTEGTVAKWLKREGEAIAKYEPLVEVITDKVNSEIPSPEAGVVSRIVVSEGQTVKVGAEIAVIEPDGGRRTADGGGETADGATASPGAAIEQGAMDAGTHQQAAAAPTAAKYTEDEVRRRSSPLVRRLAKEHGVDLNLLIPGSGTGGRVNKDDILAYIATGRSAPEVPAAVPAEVPVVPAEVALRQPEAVRPAAPTAEQPVAPAPAAPPLYRAPMSAPAPAAPLVAGADEEALPISPVRRAIAEHMVRSATTAPHAWTYVEVDATGLVACRAAQRDEFKRREGFDLTYVPFVAKALVETLREHPRLNSTWRDGQVVLKKRINLGVAVALEDNLVVPVIRDADGKSAAGLARALDDLVSRARTNQLLLDDVQGGTFTLNNTGALGSILSMPIINQPQAAILTMEAIARRVVVTAEDAIAVRPMLNLCISFDHRILDGLQVLRFLQRLKQRIEAMSGSDSIY